MLKQNRTRPEPDISFAYLLIAGTYYLAVVVKYSLICTPSAITLLLPTDRHTLTELP